MRSKKILKKKKKIIYYLKELDTRYSKLRSISSPCRSCFQMSGYYTQKSKFWQIHHDNFVCSERTSLKSISLLKFVNRKFPTLAPINPYPCQISGDKRNYPVITIVVNETPSCDGSLRVECGRSVIGLTYVLGVLFKIFFQSTWHERGVVMFLLIH